MDIFDGDSPKLFPLLDIKFLELFDHFKKIRAAYNYFVDFFGFSPLKMAPLAPIKFFPTFLRSTLGARRPEQESFYSVTIALPVTKRERFQI